MDLVVLVVHMDQVAVLVADSLARLVLQAPQVPRALQVARRRRRFLERAQSSLQWL